MNIHIFFYEIFSFMYILFLREFLGKTWDSSLIVYVVANF